ncbi:MAG TPA: TonB-dependent receptor [Terracidiphilus sp.]|nr:TonB-dependent receptor [Terracidiphilus sp.]
MNAKFSVSSFRGPVGRGRTGLQQRCCATASAGVFIILLFVVSAAVPLRAQTMGAATLEGTVTDPSNAIIVGAKVTVTSDLTGVSRILTSNSAGFYSATDLLPGSYHVTASNSGFSRSEIDKIVLTVGSVREVDVHLNVATVANSVTVSVVSNSLETVSSSVKGVVNGSTTRNLPLNGRDFTALATLQSGVSAVDTQYSASATSTTRLSRGFGSQLSIGGNRPQQISYLLDGINENDYANGSPGSVSGAILGVDAVGEFSVIESNAAAQYGRTSGGVIDSITRSGTNTFRGSVYDYLRNSVFDARNYFDPATIPPFRRNQFGASASGPILRNRTFLFGNYEGFRQSLGSAVEDVVLSPNARLGQLVSGNVTINPDVLPFLALYHTPNGDVTGDTGIYSFVTQQPTNEDFSTVHLDQNFSSNDSLHGTVLYDTSSITSADESNAVLDEALSRRAVAAIEEIHIFSPQLTNAVRLGFSRSVASGPRQQGVLNPAANDSSLGFFTGANAGSLLVSGLTTFNGGVGAVGTYTYHYNSYQLYDDVALIRGKHSFAFGGSVERDQDNEEAGLLPFGSWSFGSIKSFLTNAPTYFQSGLPTLPVAPVDLRTSIYAGYAQDSWRLRPNLTLNLGIRYEMNTDFTEVRNRLGVLVTPTDTAVTPVHSYFSNNPTLKNFEPKIGFAWDPDKKGKTVVHGAFGIYDVLPLPYFLGLQAVGSSPIYDEAENTSVTKGSFPLNGFAGFNPPVRAIYTPRNPGRNYVMQFTFNVQQQLTHNTMMTLGYIGSHGVRQPFTANDINFVQPVLDSPLGYVWPVKGTAPKLNPAIGTESGTYFEGSSIYHSLQATLKYDSTRIHGMLAYTWGHSIDDSSSALSGASFGNSIANPPYFNLRLNRGPSDFDVRHAISAYAMTVLPSAPTSFGPLAAPLRGWNLENIVSIHSGVPFTPIVGGDPLSALSSAAFDRPDRVRKTDCTHPQNIHYLDTSCFAFPAKYEYAPGVFGGRLGNAGRNSIIGPGSLFWTAGLMNEQKVSERLRIELEAQAFNVSNRANFEDPASAQSQIFNGSGSLLANAGRLTSTSTSSRQLQFALKILF